MKDIASLQLDKYLLECYCHGIIKTGYYTGYCKDCD